MVHFSHRGIIQASAASVFSVLSDPAKIPLWRKDMPKISNIVLPIQSGSTFVEEVHFMGTKQLLMVITELRPVEKLVIVGKSGMPLLPTQTFTLASHPEGTELSLDVEMNVTGVWRLLSPLLPMMLRKIWKGYFRDLDALLKKATP